MRRRSRPRVAMFLAVATWLLVIGVGAPPASAHTGFGSSDPADGATVAEPVDTITIEFTGAAEPTGNGFEVLEPSGEIRSPDTATTEDGSTWVLTFDPPLGGGVIGVRWAVKAPDAHPIEGSFSFTAPSAEPTTTSAPNEGQISPPTTPPAPTTAELPDSAAAPDTSPRTRGSASLTSEKPETPEAAAQSQPTASSSLADFLDTGSGGDPFPRRVGAIARVIILLGALVGIGALVFAAVVLRGDHHEIRMAQSWVRGAGALVVVGAVAEFISQVAAESTGEWSAIWDSAAVSDVATSTFGVAVALRVAGGLALVAGARAHIATASSIPDPVMAIKARVAVGAGPDHRGSAPSGEISPGERGGMRQRPQPWEYDGDHAWRPATTSFGAILGSAAIVAAHLFDGHTVTSGNRVLTAVVDAVHVIGGAVWVGGVVMLAAVLWQRHRRGNELRALQLAVRFSVLATLAVVVVGTAGGVLSVIVLDSPSELWATQWGRTLMAKTALVVAAGAAGAYNHRVLIPQLQSPAGDAALDHRFRLIITGEAAALIGVLIATALLMGAAS